MPPTLLIVTDAFSSIYLKYGCTPNLVKLAERNLLVKRLVPGFTYCEIAQFFTGATSKKTGIFSQFSYNKSNSEFRRISPVLKVAGLVSSNNKSIDHINHTLLSMFLEKIGFQYPIYEIPLNLINNFCLVEAGKSYYQPRAFGVESIIDVMLENEKSFFKNAFVEYNKSKGTDQTRLQMFAQSVKNQEHDLYLLYLGILDSFGHMYGPDSLKIREALKWIDRKLNSLIETTLAINPATNIIIIGDHGMSPVKNYVDILENLHRLDVTHNIKRGKDYFPFIDSTMCRLWVRSELVKKILTNSLKQLRNGFLLDDSISKNLGIPNLGPQIGELVWVCNESTVIFPDYFHINKRVAGMHGYATDSDVHNGMAIIVSPKVSPNVIQTAKLTDICPTTCDFLGIRYPQQNEGTSLVK